MGKHVGEYGLGLLGVWHALDEEGQVGAVKARAHLDGLPQAQQCADVCAHAGGCGCGEGHDGRALRQGRDDGPYPLIAGAEVMPPLADAVGLVDGHEPYVELAHEGGKALLHQLLWRDVDDVDHVGEHGAGDLALFFELERGVEEDGADACLPAGAHLV